MTAVETIVATLKADVTVTGLLADRISPLRGFQDEVFPYAIITEVSNTPENTLSGFAGIDHCEVQVDVWDTTFDGADTAARTCRSTLQSAGYICLSKVGDSSDDQLDPALTRVGFTFQVWQS